MKRINPLKIVYSAVILFFVVNAQAAIVISSDGTIGAGYHPSVHQDGYVYPKTAVRHRPQHHATKQPNIAEPAIAGISQDPTDDNPHGVVYRLKKKQKNPLGGSVHQNRLLKQYLGKNY